MSLQNSELYPLTIIEVEIFYDSFVLLKNE
jgi:hypothetical protein